MYNYQHRGFSLRLSTLKKYLCADLTHADESE